MNTQTRSFLRVASAVSVGGLMLTSSALAQVRGDLQHGTGWKTHENYTKGNASREVVKPELPILDPAMYPPVKLPLGKPAKHAPGEPVQNMFVWHDVATGLDHVLPDHHPISQMLIKANDQVNGSQGREGDEGFGDRGMGSLTALSNPEAWPNSANCRLFMEWGASGGSCSGTMIDSRMVLTAGHCLYDHGVNAFADSVRVVPGYDNGAQPFGEASMTSYAYNTAWVNNQDYDYDLVVLTVGRPVGALSGWYGYGYNTDCGWWESETFYNKSYPAESAYGFNGSTMYAQSGTFDDCTGGNDVIYNQFRYKGMSGSSYYDLQGSNRYARAVTSHRDSSGRTHNTDMWSSMFTYLRDTFIPSKYPNTVDLVPMWVRGTPTTVKAGDRLNSLSYSVHNMSDASWSGVVNLGVYLSTNSTISTGDDQLGGYGFNFAANPRTTINIQYLASDNLTPVIPKDTPSGTYYMGFIVTNADADATNNDTSGQEAFQFTVVGRPDVDVTSVNAVESVVNLGRTLDLTYTLKNLGGASSTGYTVRAYASLNTAITEFDELLDTFSTATDLTAGSSRTIDRAFTIPTTLTPGNYYIGVIVTNNNEESDTSNNTGYDAATVAITDRGDLDVISIDAEDGPFAHGDTMTVNFSVKNTGTQTISGWTGDVRASTNTAITTADTQLRTFSAGPLTPGQTRTSSINCTIPDTLAFGEYYIGMIVDTADPEIPGSNNTGYDPNKVKIDDCPADFNGDGFVTGDDFDAYVVIFTAGTIEADFNGDGFVTGDDFDAFVVAYIAGC